MVDYKYIIDKLNEMSSPCKLCPHECRADRKKGKTGKCRTADVVSVSSYNIHNGEEPPVSGTKGSGTIFFASCNLSCVFCQNYPISQLGHGKSTTLTELSKIMLELQKKGAHNINLVTPTHVISLIVEAIYIAKNAGLTIPVVYNCNGYEKLETLKLLEGVIDIYLPDMKYSDNKNAIKYSNAENYWEINTIAVKEMFRQTGLLELDSNGIAKKGLIIRHLVLPDNISGTDKVLKYISENISNKIHISLMSQYHTAYKSGEYPELSRKISRKEYNKAQELMEKYNLNNGWMQEEEYD